MKKKGIEMSMNVIIIAAIGLLILLILAFLVVQRVGNTNKALDNCNTKYAGVCQSPSSSCENTVSNTDCTQRTDGKTTCCKIVSTG